MSRRNVALGAGCFLVLGGFIGGVVRGSQLPAYSIIAGITIISMGITFCGTLLGALAVLKFTTSKLLKTLNNEAPCANKIF